MNILHKVSLLSKVKNVNECQFSGVVNSLSKIFRSANYHLLFVVLVLGLCCSIKHSSWSAVKYADFRHTRLSQVTIQVIPL